MKLYFYMIDYDPQLSSQAQMPAFFRSNDVKEKVLQHLPLT